MPRSARSRSVFAVTGVVALTAALAGCGELVVLNAGSTASCLPDGDPVTLTTSQDDAGDELSITYRGPSDLAVVFSYGYSLEDVPEADATGAYAYAQSHASSSPGDGTAYLLRLDPATDAGWSSTEAGGMLDATFSGNVDELLDGRNAFLAFEDGTAIAEVASAFVAVSCDTELESGLIDTLDSIPSLAPDLLLAAPLNPDNVRLGPFVITEQSTIDGVTTGSLRFAAGAAEAFAGFVPSTIAESTVVTDVADVPDETFSQLWFQEFLREADSSGSFAITSPLTLDGEMDFTFTSAIAPEGLPEGLHRLRIVFGNTDLLVPTAQVEAATSSYDEQAVRELDPADFTPAAAGDAKAVFFTVEYDEVAGLVFGAALPVEAAPEVQQPELADTGSSEIAWAVGVAALLLVGGGAALASRRMRSA